MQDAFRVDIRNPVYNLLDDDLYPLLVDLVIFAGYELLQVLLVVIEDYLQGLLLGLVKDLK